MKKLLWAMIVLWAAGSGFSPLITSLVAAEDINASNAPEKAPTEAGDAAHPNTFPIFHIESNTVLAPTLVTKKSGEIVYGLQHDDFTVYVDGREQIFQLNETPDFEKISIVIAVQTSGIADMLRDDKDKKPWEPAGVMSGLGTMIENFVGKMDAEIAVVNFDSRVRLAQNFTSDLSVVRNKLEALEGTYNSGVKILDAVNFSLELFQKAQPDRRRILFLISESRDFISTTTTAETLVLRLMASNIQVHSISFKPLARKLVRDLKSNKPARNDKMRLDTDPFWLVMKIKSLLSKNTVHTLVKNTGGEHIQFSDRNSLESAFITLANDFRGAYLISFQAADAKPGFHEIKIRLRKTSKDMKDLNDVIIRARKGYQINSALK